VSTVPRLNKNAKDPKYVFLSESGSDGGSSDDVALNGN
jgi:hypothetical protein